MVMRLIALVVAVLTGLIAPAFAQRAEIEAVNAKWVDFFNKGDFAGVASLYTEDATAFPPGAGMMKGRAAIEAMWKGAAEQVGDPKFITLEVKPLGPSAAQEIGTFSLLPKTQGKVGGLLAKTEQGKKLLPVECDNDEQSHKRKHFKETVHVLFGRRHLPPAVGVAHVPNCRGLGSEVDSLLFEKKTAWGRMASEKAL